MVEGVQHDDRVGKNVFLINFIEVAWILSPIFWRKPNNYSIDLISFTWESEIGQKMSYCLVDRLFFKVKLLCVYLKHFLLEFISSC